MNRNVFFALLAAALFGASTPFAKQLVGSLSPILLAGLLYLGSGVGLGAIAKSVPLTKVLRHEHLWHDPSFHGPCAIKPRSASDFKR